MALALSTVGKIAGVVAMVTAPFAPGVAAVAGLISGITQTGAALLAKKPPIQGSATNITIGANQPSPYMMGDTYSGGKMVHKVGYGPEINKVKNPYLAMSVIYSVGGPIAGIDSYYADFQPLSFSGDEATGYFSQILFRQSSVGPLLQTTALAGPWGAIPQWGSDAKLSGKAHVLWSAKWDSKNGKYNAGLPQLGIRGRGVLTWDPRADSTYPGGSGTQRWADPKDRAAFDAARATWVYTARPGLHALRYALGTWERDLNNPTSNYVLTFGIGLPLDQIVVEDFVELENICDLNGWEVSGTIEEPGDKWANMKRILETGGAEPCWKGGRLGVKITAPRIALDTITRSDLAGRIRAQGCAAWRDRINTVIPQYTSPDHKWQLQPLRKISVADFVAEDGEEKPKEQPFQLVKAPTQAAQLATYRLYDSREFGPIEIPVLPRLRHYRGGDRLNLEQAIVDELGIPHGEVIVLQRSFDPGTMTGVLTVMGDTEEKHAAALGRTGTAPPAIYIPTTEERDGASAVGTDPSIEQLLIANSYPLGITISGADMDGTANVTISAHERVYQDKTVAVDGATITGLSNGTTYWIYTDDAARAGGALTFVATVTYGNAFPSSANPARHYVGSILTPAFGGGGSSGGGGTPPGGGGSNPIP